MLKDFTVLLGNNDGIKGYEPLWKLLNWGHVKLPREQMGGGERGEGEKEKEKERRRRRRCKGRMKRVSGIGMLGLHCKEGCVGTCKAEKRSHTNT